MSVYCVTEISIEGSMLTSKPLTIFTIWGDSLIVNNSNTPLSSLSIKSQLTWPLAAQSHVLTSSWQLQLAARRGYVWIRVWVWIRQVAPKYCTFDLLLLKKKKKSTQLNGWTWMDEPTRWKYLFVVLLFVVLIYLLYLLILMLCSLNNFTLLHFTFNFFFFFFAIFFFFCHFFFFLFAKIVT